MFKIKHKLEHIDGGALGGGPGAATILEGPPENGIPILGLVGDVTSTSERGYFASIKMTPEGSVNAAIGLTGVNTQLSGQTPTVDGTTASGAADTISFQYGFNGTNWDRLGTNVALLIQPSTAIATPLTVLAPDNINHKALHLITNVTGFGVGVTYTVAIQARTISGVWYDLLVSNAIDPAIDQFYVMKIGPGIPGSPSLRSNDFLPREWRVVVTPAGGNLTLSIEANLMV